jgi:hypothetical protein
MGYSMRTPDWRYTAYLHFDKKRLLPLYDKPIFDEELYDHRFEKLGDFTHRETMNVISNSEFESVIVGLREKLLTFLKASTSSAPREKVDKVKQMLKKRLRRERDRLRFGTKRVYGRRGGL